MTVSADSTQTPYFLHVKVDVRVNPVELTFDTPCSIRYSVRYSILRIDSRGAQMQEPVYGGIQSLGSNSINYGARSSDYGKRNVHMGGDTPGSKPQASSMPP